MLVYGGAVFTVLLLSLATSPVASQRFGIITPSVEEKKKELFNPHAFDMVKVQGRAYVVYDIVGQTVIAGKDETKSLPLASITKIMMALTARMHHDKNATIVLASTPTDGFDLGLKKSQTWKLSELLKYTLVFSSNDGAEAIAQTFGGRDAFVGQMNADAAGLGLMLHFTDPAGLDTLTSLGGEGSALEVAKLLAVARVRFPEILDATTHERITVTASTGRISGVPNTNQVISGLSGAEASKTGFTDFAGGNLAVIVDISVGHPIAIVVLGSTREDRFTDVETLYQALRKSIVP